MTPLRGSDSNPGRLGTESPGGGLGAPAGKASDTPVLSGSPAQTTQEA